MVSGYFALVVYSALIVCVGVGLLLLAARQKDLVPTESRDRELLLNRVPVLLSPTPGQLLSGKFQRALENSSRDGLPFLPDIMPVLVKAQAELDAVSLSPFPGGWPRPVGVKGIMMINGGSRQTRAPQLYTEEGRQKYEEAAGCFNQLASANPDVRTTVCLIPRAGDWYVESDACSDESRKLFRGLRHIREFGRKLGESVRLVYWGYDRSPREALRGY